jgi:hypothetical protein
VSKQNPSKSKQNNQSSNQSSEGEQAQGFELQDEQRDPQETGALIAADDHAQRAEELVDQASLQVGTWLSQAGRLALWATMRVREEAEDIYAEAEQLRQTWRQ